MSLFLCWVACLFQIDAALTNMLSHVSQYDFLHNPASYFCYWPAPSKATDGKGKKIVQAYPLCMCEWCGRQTHMTLLQLALQRLVCDAFSYVTHSVSSLLLPLPSAVWSRFSRFRLNETEMMPGTVAVNNSPMMHCNRDYCFNSRWRMKNRPSPLMRCLMLPDHNTQLLLYF